MKLSKFILINLFFFPIYLTLLHCALLKDFIGSDNQPSFSVNKIEISKITLENINLRIESTLKNPYPVSLPGSYIKLDVFIEGSKLTQIPKIEVGKISGNSSIKLPIDILIKYSDLVELYKKIPGKEILLVKADGVLKIPIPETYQFAGSKELDFPFVQEKQIPAILPSIAIRNFKIIKPEPSALVSGSQSAVNGIAMNYIDSLLGGKKTSLMSATEAGLGNIDITINTEFEIVLTNKAGARLNFNDLKYDLDLGTEKFLGGRTESITNNGNESIVNVRTGFPLKSLSNSLASTIQKRTSPFRIRGASGLKVSGIPDGMLNFEYDKSGSFSW